jgi:ectoine hydroxylase-related dioxygenase (phytanoyl-CoA dioxygenase family)
MHMLEQSDAEFGLYIEELENCGFTVLRNVVASSILEHARHRLDSVYERQVAEVGAQVLVHTKEENIARCPLAYDSFFVQFATVPAVIETIHKLLRGKFILLHLQNGIINRPHEPHHQAHWHRDLPYQEFVSTRPLAISALFCIDDFTEETGCTCVLPNSHRVEAMPSEAYTKMHQHPVIAPAGSVILFDAMLFHRAGHNASTRVRRGMNHVYSVPIIRQQIDLARAVESHEVVFQDPAVRLLLGLDAELPGSVRKYREQRAARLGISIEPSTSVTGADRNHE